MLIKAQLTASTSRLSDFTKSTRIVKSAYYVSAVPVVSYIYSGINKDVNKKEGAILRYFNIYNILKFII